GSIPPRARLNWSWLWHQPIRRTARCRVIDSVSDLDEYTWIGDWPARSEHIHPDEIGGAGAGCNCWVDLGLEHRISGSGIGLVEFGSKWLERAGGTTWPNCYRRSRPRRVVRKSDGRTVIRPNCLD